MSVLELIDREELKRLSARSDAHAAWITACNFALLAAGFALPALWPHWLAWVTGALILAGRALGLAILVHDTAHQTFFSSRRFNEWAGKWLFGGLPNVPYHAYRKGHLEHHRNAGTGQDPDLAFVQGYPASAASLLRKLARDVSGINGVRNILYQLRNFTLAAQAPFLLSHAFLFGILLLAGHPEVYLCWWLGQLFFFPLVVRLRVMGEHGGVADHFDSDPRNNTGTTLAGPLARLLWAPNFVNFHLEHHYASGVPPYRLKAMHELIKSKGHYAGRDCIQPSYWGVLRRCWAGASTRRALGKGLKAKGSLNNMQ
jgi:fatty acid desaturase